MDVIQEAHWVFDREIAALEATRDSLGAEFETMVDLVLHCRGKVIITGMGKPGHIGAKLAATLASLGTPAFFMHPAEAMHGDLGMVTADDVVLLASYSGESDEVGPDVIIASNTSAMNIFEIVPEQLLPQQLICHWYSPPQLIPLVEVVKSEQAPQELADTAMALLKKCGKTAVLMKKFIRGYIANRLQQCINQEVFYLLEHGYCDAEAIDLAVKASFIPRACVLGLCKRMDFGGVDMTANNFRNHSYEMPHPPADEPIPHVLEEMVDRGELGIKTGKGFYDYSDVDIEELKAKRDKQLFEVFRLEKKFLDDPV